MGIFSSKITKIFCIFCLLCFWGLLLLWRSPKALADSTIKLGQPIKLEAKAKVKVASSLRPETPTTCAIRPRLASESPENRENETPENIDIRREDFSANRFRRGLSNLVDNLRSGDQADPPERIASANPTNYGDRFFLDLQGNAAYHSPIIVLHETVATVNQTLGFFQTPHRNEEEQTSYHTLIGLDGQIIYVVPPDKRAFGAGDSIFANQDGEETVQTNPNYPPSVNNFAYHISLESPDDGLNNRRTHSGYTQAQYRSLAWLVAKTGVPENRITTHREVDRSGQRIDPRSFDQDSFRDWYRIMPKTQEISIACTPPAANSL